MKRPIFHVNATLFAICLLTISQNSCRHLSETELKESIVLACPFDKNLHACANAKNPYSASGNVSIVNNGTNGVAKFAGQDSVNGMPCLPQNKSALIFDGKNIPEKGSLGFRIRWSGKRNWGDGKRTWLAVLVPNALQENDKLGEKGTALALTKEKDNTITLAAYQTAKNKRNIFITPKSGYDVGEPDKVLLKFPCKDLAVDSWSKLRVAWDAAEDRIWLTLGDKTTSADCEIKSPDFRCLILGSSPRTSHTVQRGFDGEIDDLVIENVTPNEDPLAALTLPAGLESVSIEQVNLPAAKFLLDSAEGKRLEQYTRAHVNNVIDSQQSGGWAFSVSLPSKMRFISTKKTTPEANDYVSCSKEQNSAGAAVRLLAAYEALGDKACLDAAKKTAELFLKLQKIHGYWFYAVRVAPNTGKVKWIYRPDLAPFEDHVQSAPVLLMLRLYQLTGDERYKVSALKGIEFIYNGQNPTGSWSHHYDAKTKCGHAARGQKYAGEINDYTTTGQMKVMLVAYRITGKPKYLASYLKAADWLVSAFVDTPKVKGWALQYDQYNTPIRARHFEPESVALSEGINSVPPALINAYRVTGDRKYIEPLYKWRKWMRANRVESKKYNKKGWYRNYDCKTGAPIQMSNNKISPADPRSIGDHGYSSLLNKIDRIEDRQNVYKPSPETARKALLRNGSSPDKKYKWNIEYLLNHFDEKNGTWTYSLGPVGRCFSPPTVRILYLCWALFVNRQLNGQLAWDHPMGQLTMFEWADICNHVIHPKECYKRLTAQEMNNAMQ